MVWGPEMLAELMEVLPRPMPDPLLSEAQMRKQSPFLVPFYLCLYLSFSFTPSIYASMFQCTHLTKCVCTCLSMPLCFNVLI